MTPGELIAGLTYKPGWAFKLGGPFGRYLCVFATTVDSHHPERTRCTQHQFEIPDGVDLVRWAFDCLLLCERHEAGEFFAVAGDRRFYPHHQDEGSPYVLVDHWRPDVA